MSSFTPQELPPETAPFFEDADGTSRWIPITQHDCAFSGDIFLRVMENLIKNPNINSKWLFRADILYDDKSHDGKEEEEEEEEEGKNTVKKAQSPQETTFHQKGADDPLERGSDIAQPLSQRHFKSYDRQRTLVRKLIPRNEKRDAPLLQTCTIYTREPDTILVIYLPHLTSPSETPFYHPAVAGIAHLHTPRNISVHFLPFASSPPSSIHANEKLLRTARQLLLISYKHGVGQAAGYTKRVRHDQVIPQEPFQDRYASLKAKYAKKLVDGWMEVTDSTKHVFEDLGIAAFLIELWREMYVLPGQEEEEEEAGQQQHQKGHDQNEEEKKKKKKKKKARFPGFVDVGCGNGLLVYILNQEGFSGWGFDARSRKSWAQYSLPCETSPGGKNLEQRLLVPSVIQIPPKVSLADSSTTTPLAEDQFHNGEFPDGVFIISNHADELTPWTPILSILSGSHHRLPSPALSPASSDCQKLSLEEATATTITTTITNPFIIIPCCSHSLTGAKYRAPPPRPLPRNEGKGKSSYASLVDWTEQIAEDCGWIVEREMLRIPSTRNTCLVGRRRKGNSLHLTVDEIVTKYGGVDGFYENVAKLAIRASNCH